jgi:hypothetical protein
MTRQPRSAGASCFLDVALPLVRIGAMLIALVLDRDAQVRIGKVHAADEPAAGVEDVVVGHGLRQSRVDDHQTHPRLHP